jgi:hypothetical protein
MHPIGNPHIDHMFDRFELIYSRNIARDVCLTYVVCSEGKRGVTNTLAMPIDKILYIYLLCPHSEHHTKICSNLNSLKTFTKETGSNKVKLPRVRSNEIVPVPVGAGPNKFKNYFEHHCQSVPPPPHPIFVR